MTSKDLQRDLLTSAMDFDASAVRRSLWAGGKKTIQKAIVNTCYEVETVSMDK
jgi:hypothetical protein